MAQRLMIKPTPVIQNASEYADTYFQSNGPWRPASARGGSARGESWMRNLPTPARGTWRRSLCPSASEGSFCLREAYVIDPGTLAGIAAIIAALKGLLAELRKWRR
jgi:hypothetical protein